MKKFKTDLEMWGGVECTVNRIQDIYFDQLRWNGHERRINDLDLFASLGLRTLRQPFLWEKIAPESNERANWTWVKERLARLRGLQIQPIIGLLHHGSGPRHTSLLDPHFSEKFSAYAASFAQRFPELEFYTPINEPLTTARFSGLYGFWYPHAKDNHSFFRALLNQCRGIVLAMREIRKVNPGAKLVQTEDLGKARSSPRLIYQVEHENHRRWLSLDLLFGRVNREHPLWCMIRHSGIAEKELRWFGENSCVPDIIGINHYLLSNRYLDENLQDHEPHLHGGNGRDAYVDVAAIHVPKLPPILLDTLLLEAWKRFKQPLAVTEVHVDAPREEQLRWLIDVWNLANSARDRGADVRAVTAWGLLGHFDWKCLLTRCEGYYESGVFDVRSGIPRPTALAGAVKSLATNGSYFHPVLAAPGHWRTQNQEHSNAPASKWAKPSNRTRPAPVLITGGGGTLGRAFVRVCEQRRILYRQCLRRELDISDQKSVTEILRALRPWAVVNAAGYVHVDKAEEEPEACFKENLCGAVNLASACAQLQVPFLSFSSDLVFDGAAKSPYFESSLPNPLNTYGLSKFAAERGILQRHPESMVVRTSAFFGPWDEANFLHVALKKLREGDKVYAPRSQRVSPTYVPDLVHTSLNLLLDGAAGMWHLANYGEVTWEEFAHMGAKLAQADTSRIISVPAMHAPPLASRPAYSVLGTERGVVLPPLEEAIERYFREVNV